MSRFAIGHHNSKNHIENVLDEAMAEEHPIDFEAFQIAVSPMQNFNNGLPFNKHFLQKLSEYAHSRIEKGKQPIYIVVHGKYGYNFARKAETIKYQFQCFVEECKLVRTLSEANGTNVPIIIHQGKNVASEKMSREEALQNFVDNIKTLFEKLHNEVSPPLDDITIVLENSAHQGTEMGYSVSELATIYSMIDDEYKSRIKFCIDTCHAFVSGEMDVRSPVAVRAFFDDFDRQIGFSKLEVIHFNDSQAKFGAKNDHHDDIGMGFAGSSELGGNIDGLMEVAIIARERGIPLILETPHTHGAHYSMAQYSFVREFAITGSTTQYQDAMRNYLQEQQQRVEVEETKVEEETKSLNTYSLFSKAKMKMGKLKMKSKKKI